jgi:hypothetical protein
MVIEGPKTKKGTYRMLTMNYKTNKIVREEV